MTKQEFLKDVTNWDNYKYNLWVALTLTQGAVVEFGCGQGSTDLLRKYCKETGREFMSFESNQDYARQYNSLHVTDWDTVNLTYVDVLFIDHAPGERRWVDIKKYANIAKVIVIHDSEPHNKGYMLDKIWHLFKYKKNFETNGAWTTTVSNFIDVTKWSVGK